MIELNNSKNKINVKIDEKYRIIFSNEDISQALLKPIYELQKNSWEYKDSNDNDFKSFNSLCQIKINITDIGFISLYFNQEKLPEEKRNELFDRIKQLKDLDSNVKEFRKQKISAIITIASEYGAVFVFAAFYQFFGELSLMLSNVSNDINFTIIATSISKEMTLEKEEKRGSIKKTKNDENTSKDNSEKTNNLFKNLVVDFKKNLATYLFNLIYGLLLGAVSLFLLVFFKQNHAGDGIIFIIFIAVFAFVIVSNTYSYIKNRNIKDEFKEDWLNYLIFLLLVLIGLAVGIIVANVVSVKVLDNEDYPINYTTITLFSILISIITYIFCVAIAFIYKYIKNKPRTKKDEISD